MAQQVFRPKAEDKKINTRNEFELCYLRHQYFRKATVNPDDATVKPYLSVCKRQASNTYFTYQNLFGLIGMEREDLYNIAIVHLVSFLGLFSLDVSLQKRADFMESFFTKNKRIATEDDIFHKNRANFTSFLKQRMEEMVRISRQKARNIKGMITDEFQAFYGPKRPPRRLKSLLSEYERHGFRKLDGSVFKSIRKRSGSKEHVFKFEDSWYVCVPLEHRNINIQDLTGAGMNPHDNIHNMNPEKIMEQRQEIQYWEDKKQEFFSLSDMTKSTKLKRFIRINKDDPKFEEEIELARKMLKGLEG